MKDSDLAGQLRTYFDAASGAPPSPSRPPEAGRGRRRGVVGVAVAVVLVAVGLVAVASHDPRDSGSVATGPPPGWPRTFLVTNDTGALLEVDLDGTVARVLTETRSTNGGPTYPVRSPDQATVYFVQHLGTCIADVRAVDTTSGAVTTDVGSEATGGGGPPIALDRTGRHLAWFDAAGCQPERPSTVQVLDLSNGLVTTIPMGASGDDWVVVGLDWHPDGRTLVAETRQGLLLVDVDRGVVEPLPVQATGDASCEPLFAYVQDDGALRVVRCNAGRPSLVAYGMDGRRLDQAPIPLARSSPGTTIQVLSLDATSDGRFVIFLASCAGSAAACETAGFGPPVQGGVSSAVFVATGQAPRRLPVPPLSPSW